MTIRPIPPGRPRPTPLALASCAAFAALAVAALAAPAASGIGSTDPADGRFCSATAQQLARSCAHEAADDYHRGLALCTNIANPGKRQQCVAAADAARAEATEECGEQKAARIELCGLLGEARYDPGFAPADFQTDFAHPERPNAYFPLRPGLRWKYRGGDETIVVKVLARTKLIDGVTCIVVNDRVTDDGDLVEDTDDWFALRRDGSVFYCGEIARNYERFDGDQPALPELVDVDGSWKAGRDGDLPGLLFPGAPAVGMVYRQEFSPNNAEDAAIVVSTRYAYGRQPSLDAFVPAALARYLCSAADCVVTREFSPLDPGHYEYKYYARGIGLFLEVDPLEGSHVRLVECNVDPRCDGLAALPAR